MTAPDAARLADWRALPSRLEAVIEIGQDRLSIGWLQIIAEAASALRQTLAELSAIHATTEWQRWARAVAERDAAREAVRRVEAVADEVCCTDCHADLRAALAGPGAGT